MNALNSKLRVSYFFQLNLTNKKGRN